MGVGSGNCSPTSLVEAEAAAPGLPPEQQVAWPGLALHVHRGAEAWVLGHIPDNACDTPPPRFFFLFPSCLYFFNPET